MVREKAILALLATTRELEELASMVAMIRATLTVLALPLKVKLAKFLAFWGHAGVVLGFAATTGGKQSFRIPSRRRLLRCRGLPPEVSVFNLEGFAS